MKKLDRLIKEAKESCLWRDHDMKPFEHCTPKIAISNCKKCNMGVVVRTNPLPNQIDIGGEAVALNCKGEYDANNN